MNQRRVGHPRLRPLKNYRYEGTRNTADKSDDKTVATWLFYRGNYLPVQWKEKKVDFVVCSLREA